MDFEEIDELNEKDMNALYNDIVEFGDNAHISACVCYNCSRYGRGGETYREQCVSWCRSIGSRCKGYLTCYNGYCTIYCDYGGFSC